MTNRIKRIILSKYENYIFLFKEMYCFNRSAYLILGANFLINCVDICLGIVLPILLIDELLGLQRVAYICCMILLYIITTKIFSLLKNFIKEYFEKVFNISFSQYLSEKLVLRFMKVPYKYVEDKEMIDIYEKAFNAVNGESGVTKIIEQFFSLITNFVLFLIFFLVLVIKAPYLLLVQILITLVLVFFQNKRNKVEFEVFKKNSIPNRILSYFINISSDLQHGKDVRLYEAKDIFLNKIEKYKNQLIDNEEVKQKKVFKINSILELLKNLILIVCYFELGILCIQHKINFAMFYFLISCSGLIIYLMEAISGSISSLKNNMLYVNSYVDVIMSTQKKQKMLKNKISTINNIEFRNVYFKYPRSMCYTLEDVSVSIHKGENIGIVGENGAGKTTFIKLLSRLYEIDKGEILINGKNIYDYKEEEYWKLIGTLFQDFGLFATTIRENIVFGNKNIQEKHVQKIYKSVGLQELISRLERKDTTNVIKRFDDRGIELSGGEKQKLALARIIHKNPPLVLLDEPTASLDSFSENEIIHMFETIMNDRNKTCIIVSHRLLTCTLCDKIIVFSEGKIVEQGTHKELMEKQGKYYKFFEKQVDKYIY